MKTLHHPTLPATVSVPEKDVDAWTEAGWLKGKPKALREAEKADDK